jgi:hypothetical protein
MLVTLQNLLATIVYLAILPWKQGERDACGTMSNALAPHFAPLFEIPPAGDFDHELGHIPSPAEHIRQFGPRLHRCRGRLPVFVDATQIDDERHRAGGAVHPLTALIERAHRERAQAWPVVRFDNSDEYKNAVRRARDRHGSPLAIRLELSDLERSDLADALRGLCKVLNCERQEVMLLVDGKSLQVGDVSEFVSLLVTKLNELPFLGDWGQLAFAATSLSDPQKMAPDTAQSIPRKEWTTYESLLRSTDLIRRPIFSDYGVEFRQQLRPVRGVRPTAKMDYTTIGEHFYVKGLNVKKAGYEAIYPVARKIAQSGKFMGSSFSKGDHHIVLLSDEKIKPGNAPKWRWATLDHHFNLTVPAVAAKLGLRVASPEEERPSPQDDLFDGELKK